MANGEWIWYPGDFEIDLACKFNSRRYERGVIMPQVWSAASPYRVVTFKKSFELKKDDVLYFSVEGQYNIALNGLFVYDTSGVLPLGKGKYDLEVSVYNYAGLPALKIDSESIVTGGDFFVNCEDRKDVPAACDPAFLRGCTPNTFRLPTREMACERVFETNGKTVYDFGKEIMAFLRFTASKEGQARIYYGESPEEACDEDNCMQIDFVRCEKGENVTEICKAFRYVCIENNVQIFNVAALCEYLPQPKRARLVTGDARLNKIYETSFYTLHLNSREFFIDGIKRDRWVWGGDFYQCALMNYYAFFDLGLYRRTFRALIGKSPFKHYTNHIMDYSLLMMISLRQYLEATGDDGFVRDIYPQVKEMAQFCLSRRDEHGLLPGRPEDWVFIDWADGMDNEGTVCAEQILLSAALRSMQAIAEMLQKKDDALLYAAAHAKAKESLEMFWDEEKGGYFHSYKEGKPVKTFLRQDNVFAVLFGDCGEARRRSILKNILQNDKIPPIVTPYFKFYELEALCMLGCRKQVLAEIVRYWGKMLDIGATTFWELFDEKKQGIEHYYMYGRKFGKSLCHAWGAAPLYLLGRYFLNAEYRRGELILGEPDVLLGDFRAELPVPNGLVHIERRGGEVKFCEC